MHLNVFEWYIISPELLHRDSTLCITEPCLLQRTCHVMGLWSRIQMKTAEQFLNLLIYKIAYGTYLLKRKCITTTKRMK